MVSSEVCKMKAVLILLLLATILTSLKAQSEDLELNSTNTLENLERCELLNLQLEQKVIDFKFRLIELESHEELIKVLKDTIKVQEASCESSLKSIEFCKKTLHDSLKEHMDGCKVEPGSGKSIEPITVVGNSCFANGYTSDVKEFHYPGTQPFSVLCDGNTAGPGWSVIQRRIDGSENFYRKWKEYREGFGNLKGEHFIGLNHLYLMTNYQPHELYIQLIDFKNETSYARYDLFEVGNEAEKYKLKKLGKMTGNVLDKLVDHLGSKFSTYDQDNDNSEKENIARKYLGGWWYFEGRLHGCNLNGQYFAKESTNNTRLHWKWKGFKDVKMLIRPTH